MKKCLNKMEVELKQGFGLKHQADYFDGVKQYISW